MKRYDYLIWGVLLLSLSKPAAAWAEDYRIVNQDSNDVTVLRAFVREDFFVGKVININRCEHKESSRQYNQDYRSYNCAWELADAMTGTPVSPTYHVRTVNGQIEGMYAQTPVVEIHTLITLEIFEKISEIGFSLSSYGGTIHKYQKNQTREVQKVRMRDGRVGLVHRFVMPFQATGGTSHCTIRAVAFKPFVTFHDHPTKTEYRNWDDANGRGMFKDYRLTNFHYRNDRCDKPDVVNREEQLLQ